jgi:hypothetical protein
LNCVDIEDGSITIPNQDQSDQVDLPISLVVGVSNSLTHKHEQSKDPMALPHGLWLCQFDLDCMLDHSKDIQAGSVERI